VDIITIDGRKTNSFIAADVKEPAGVSEKEEKSLCKG
jgi:hypothetical protein